jgi:hypothetical protein
MQSGRLIVTAGDESLLGKLRAGDRVVTTQHGPARAGFVARARAAGARVLLPPIGMQLAGWTLSQLAVAAAMSDAQLEPSTLGAARVVPPLVAAAPGEVIVDVTAAPSRVVDRSAVDGAVPYEDIAAARAAALVNGRTRP